ncbi:hypothetical protein F2Q69_00013285 [Brassica cretica]|uniref:Arabidopsis retrotransposon Orf1 C-terminal domain-containing protein n=1 Tax=Brassica cretica TaxID=69181 RepID=A0A8S9RA13_BRACR|nr:hypothetical protein F2Q69_00013285 [Brassica cretica]
MRKTITWTMILFPSLMRKTITWTMILVQSLMRRKNHRLVKLVQLFVCKEYDPVELLKLEEGLQHFIFETGEETSSQFHIRNPVLRIAAKVLSNLLFTKDQTSKVTRGELQMLCAGVEGELKSSDIGIPTAPMTTSPGCVLAQMFVDKKARVVKGSLKKDRSGSLLTPLFRHLELDLSVYQCNETAVFIDIPYLINCQILRDENTYSFLSQDGRNIYCKLRQPNITSLSDVTNICFVPDAQYLCADPNSSYRDDTMDDVEFVRTDGGDNAYDLGPLDDNAEDATYRRWMVDSQRKNNSLMKRILKAIIG